MNHCHEFGSNLNTITQFWHNSQKVCPKKQVNPKPGFFKILKLPEVLYENDIWTEQLHIRQFSKKNLVLHARRI